MAKLTLNASPTFTANVNIPVPGKAPVPVRFTFKGRTKTDFKAFMESLTNGEERDDVDVILDLASGWELEDAFDREGIEKLTQNYIGSARAVIEVYITELTAARAKN